MNQITKKSMIEDFAVIGLQNDPNPILQNQKWLTSIKITHLRQNPSENQYIQIKDESFLCLGYNEKNLKPISEIIVGNQNYMDWHLVENSKKSQSNQYLLYRHIGSSEQIRTIKSIFIALKQDKIDEDAIKIEYKDNVLVVQFNKSVQILKASYQPIILHPKTNHKNYLLSLHQFCFPSGIKLSTNLHPYRIFTFILTLETGERLNCTCLIAWEHLHNQIFSLLFSNQPIYYQKAFVIVSKYLLTDYFLQAVQALYIRSQSEQNFILHLDAINSHLQNKGLKHEQLHQTAHQIEQGAWRSTSSQIALLCLFKTLSVDNIQRVVKLILLERQIFLVCSSQTITSLAIEALISLIFPLKWQHLLVPLTPTRLIECLEAPIPIIAGLTHQNFSQNLAKNAVLVDLDNNMVSWKPEKKQNLKCQMSEILSTYDMYDKDWVEQFVHGFQHPSFFKILTKNSHFKHHKLRNQILTYMRKLLGEYQKFISPIQNNNFTSFNEIFSLKKLRDHHKLAHHQFQYQFRETSLFSTFIERRYTQPNHPEFLLFQSEHFFCENQIKNYTECKNPEFKTIQQNQIIQQEKPMINQGIICDKKISNSTAEPELYDQRQSLTTQHYEKIEEPNDQLDQPFIQKQEKQIKWSIWCNFNCIAKICTSIKRKIYKPLSNSLHNIQ